MINKLLENKHFINASALTIEKIIAFPITFFVSVLVARYLGAEFWGVFNYALSIVSVIGVITGLGLENIVIRELVKNEDRKNELLGSALFIRLIATTIGFFSVLSISFFHSDYYSRMVILIMSFEVLFSFLNPFEWFFNAKVKTKYIAIVRFISVILTASVKLLFIYLEMSLLAFAFSGLITLFITILLNLYLFTSKFDSLKNLKVKFEDIKYFLKNSWPLLLSGLVAIIYMRIDQIMITNMLTSADNGNYSVAVRISELYYIIPGTATTALLPWLIMARKNDYSLYLKRLQKLYFSFFWLAVFVSFVIYFFSEYGITLLFGNEYLNSVPALKIHIWGSVIVSVGLITNKWIIVENLQKYEFNYLLVGALVNIILNYLMIPKFGINGAAFATVVAQFIANILAPLLFSETRIIIKIIALSIINYKIEDTKF
ncbi:MAG: flippase [Candidatus Delongbacteria bacterium]|nr:flippase [Candidatus Delongbacteria bacterium]MBN2836856.1 flippase [Candidatus Delongbacteria bacterium]